jgi:hypothetical protein
MRKRERKKSQQVLEGAAALQLSCKIMRPKAKLKVRGAAADVFYISALVLF